MPRKFGAQPKPTEEPSVSPLVCRDCGTDLGKPSDAVGPDPWEHGPVFHCNGQSKAFNAKLQGMPHHYTNLHPRCMVCGTDLGCPRCSGPLRELLCLARGPNKPHWGSREALNEHGRLLESPEERREALNFLRSAVGLAAGELCPSTKS